MKRLKSNQLGPWCSYCPEKTTRASYRFCGNEWSTFSCDEHKEDLREDEELDERMTEADYQTWHSL